MSRKQMCICLWALLPAVVVPSGCESQPAYCNLFLEQPSPSGQYVATVYNYSPGGNGFLGATIAGAVRVNLRERAETFAPNRGQIAAIEHSSRLRLVWVSDTRLRIDYASSAILREHTMQAGQITIEARAVPQNQLPFVNP